MSSETIAILAKRWFSAGELEGSGRAPLEQDPTRRSVRALTDRAVPYTLLEPPITWGYWHSGPRGKAR
jgi:hypothetical protein